jgi:tetratricopeptide (TPR) repeat protein
LLVLFVVLVPTRAEADAKQDAKPHIVAADAAYKLGKFESALAEYSKAYEIFKAPGLLFNIGQCHRNLHNYERAIFFYEGFLRAQPKAPNRSVVEALVTEARDALAKQKAAEEAAVAARRAEADAERLEAQRRADEAARQRALAESEKLDASRRDREERRPFYKKWWFWTVLAGVAAGAGGTAYYFSGETTYTLPAGSVGGLDRR